MVKKTVEEVEEVQAVEPHEQALVTQMCSNCDTLQPVTGTMLSAGICDKCMGFSDAA